MTNQPTEMRRRASALCPVTTADVQGDKHFSTPYPLARGTYRYDRQNRTQVIEQGNRRLVVHYQNPPAKTRAWLIPAGMGMMVLLLLIFVMSAIAAWWNNWQTDQKYGLPRAYQVDAVVGHNDSDQRPSHFIFQNLHGHIVIIEMSGGDPAHTHIYTGPTLLGDRADKAPATADFDDETGKGTIDMVVHVENQRIVFLNDGTQFKQQTETRLCRMHCQVQGYATDEKHIYSEIGSGSDGYNRRPQLTALLEAAKQGAFDVLVIATHNRLSRRLAHAAAIIDELQQYGVQVESVDGHNPDDVTPLVQALREHVAGIERQMINRRIKYGIAAKKAQR